MNAITEFLLARIAEQEEAVEVAREYVCSFGGSPLRPAIQISSKDGHILWSTEQLLAECAAKRAIVDVATSWVHSYMDEDMWYSCPLAVAPGETEVGSGYSGDDGAVCRCGLEDRQLKLLLPLAAIYSDHPDYQEEWTL